MGAARAALASFGLVFNYCAMAHVSTEFIVYNYGANNRIRFMYNCHEGRIGRGLFVTYFSVQYVYYHTMNRK